MDPKSKPNPPKYLDTETDAGAYVLGIMWGTLSIFGGRRYWLRHRDRWYIETAREFLHVSASVHTSYSNTGNQARLKIFRGEDAYKVTQLLDRHGWARRKAEERPYPQGPVDDRGFVRAWVELHSCADITYPGRKRKATPRLRIYGNEVLMEEINAVLCAAIGSRPRKLQKTVNEITKALYFTGRSYRAVLDWLYQTWELSNDKVRDKFYDVAAEVEAI